MSIFKFCPFCGQKLPGVVTFCPLCGKQMPASASKDQQTITEAGEIFGKIFNAQGEPLPNANVYLTGGITKGGGECEPIKIISNAEGKYSVKPPLGIYKIHANAIFQFGKKQYTLDLHPMDESDTSIQTTSGERIEKNFQLKLTGLRCGEDPAFPKNYYGGNIGLTLSTGLPDIGPDLPVQITLTPVGTLVDGSKGSVLAFTRKLYVIYQSIMEPLDDCSVLYDIPIGQYNVTASVSTPKGVFTLLLLTKDMEIKPNEKIEFDWDILWNYHSHITIKI